MAYNPNIPAPTNRVQDDIAAMRNNFQHLAPLAPYVQALLDSRIVDHNLDVADPPNGHYVRYADGRQECWVAVAVPINAGTWADGVWTYPAVFADAPNIVTGLHTSGGSPLLTLDQDIGMLQRSESQVRWVVRNNTSENRTLTVYLRAVGRWQ